jgi:carbonic anhydrase
MYQNLQKKGSTMNADQALKLLLDGNKRFVNGNRSYPHQDSRRIQDLAQGQYPWATILSCSDSRVPPEHIFDVGLGDLFIVRVAGNICGEIEIGSLEYAVEHLRTPLIAVLGHTSCGTVTAAVEQSDTQSNLVAEGSSVVADNLSDVLNKITPTVARTMQQDPKLSGSRLITAVVHENVWQSIEDILRYSSVIRNSVRDQRVSLVGSLYHIEKGSVDWLGPHPRQKHLVATSSSPIDPGGKIPLWKGMFSSSSRYR